MIQLLCRTGSDVLCWRRCARLHVKSSDNEIK